MTAAARSPSPKARCSWPSTSPSKLNTRAVVAYPSANRRGTGTWVRIVAVGSGGDIGSHQSVLEPGRERVAQQHHVADLADLGERRAPAGVPGETAVAHEPWGPRVADEERSDHQLQLVGEVVGQKLGVHLAAALDHQPLHAAGAEVLADPAHLDRLATVDHGRHRPSRERASSHPRARAIDELLASRRW